MLYKLSIAVLLSVFFTTVSAEFVGPGAKSTHVKVSQVKGLRDDTRVNNAKWGSK